MRKQTKNGKRHGLYKPLRRDIKQTENVVEKARAEKYPTSNNAETAINIAKTKTKAKFNDNMISKAISSDAEKKKSRRERDIIAKENVATAILNIGQALNGMVNKNNKAENHSNPILPELKEFIRSAERGPSKKKMQTALLINTAEMISEYCYLKGLNQTKQETIADLVDFAESIIDAQKMNQ